MEYNSLILGKIPNNNNCGFSKTYAESIIRVIEGDYGGGINKILNYGKIYLEKETDRIVLESDRKSDKTYKEVVVLNVFPYGGVTQHGYLSFNYLYEVIEKDILYRHLQDERMILERELDNESKQLSLK